MVKETAARSMTDIGFGSAASTGRWKAKTSFCCPRPIFAWVVGLTEIREQSV
jgi:hypothetical protein